MNGPLTALRRWRNRRLCQAAHDRIHQIVDGEIPSERERARLERHVELCAPCYADAGKLKELKAAIARVGSEPDPAVKARLLELLEQVRSGQCDLESDDSPT